MDKSRPGMSFADAGLAVDLEQSSTAQLTIIGLCAHIDHASISVVDLEDAIDRYQRLLNFELVDRRFSTGDATSMTSTVMKAGSATIVLIHGTTPESQVSRFIEKFGPGVQQLALGVDNLHATLRRLEAGGGAADIEVIEEEGIRQVFLRRDPGSGLRIELIEQTTGNFSDASSAKLFRAFEAPNLY